MVAPAVVVSLSGLNRMRLMMGLIKDRHGTYYARKKVPKRLEAAVAQALESRKPRLSWLKKSLGTKRASEANVRVKPVLIEFDKTLARAEGLLKERPIRASLTQIEIARMAEYYYATLLANDAAARRHAAEVREPALPLSKIPAFGLTDAEFERMGRGHEEELKGAKPALARGNIGYVEGEIEELLHLFRIRLDERSAAYRGLGAAVLAEHVKGMQALQRRHVGEPIDTPRQPEFNSPEAQAEGNTLRAAFEGWKRERRPSPRTLMEYGRAISLFVELSGDLPVFQIKRSHARAYREALQQIPRHRAGPLLKAPLHQVIEWAKENPTAPKVSAATVNKLIGGVQATLIWAHDKGGFIADDVAWADPFARMRLEVDEPEREPFDTDELQTLFHSAVFAGMERPKAGRGDAAYWLPLLALFTGGRRGELAALTAADVRKESSIGEMLWITENRESGKTLKTKNSQRVVLVHPELVRLGFLEFVQRRREDRDGAWLFPLIAPNKPGAVEAWTKWFGRYIRALGIKDKDKVFHSLRHNFVDALRAGGVDEELRVALAGHGWMNTTNRGYGAKEMLRRFTATALAAAIAKVAYPGLDLSHLHPTKHKTRARHEPPRVCRRPFGLSHAAMAGFSSMA
jgi:integrase